MKRWFAVLVLVFVDQLTKVWVVHVFLPGDSRAILEPVLYFTYVQNTGAAFGLFKGHVSVFMLVSVLVAGGVGIELLRLRQESWRILTPLVFILSGAIGNLIDRARLGYVVDFIDLRVWPVFNVADSCITVGVIWLILHMMLTKRRTN